jgi:hypothetical protein
MSRHLLAFLCAAAPSLYAQAQTASTVLPGVTIGGSTYDVTFTQGSNGFTRFNDVFGTGSPTLSFNDASAPGAVAAILAAVAAARFDITPGASNPAAEAFMLPFSYTANTFSYYAGWTDTPGNAFVGVFGPFADRTRTSARAASIVTFTVSPIPEPSAAPLALVGMGVVMWAWRREGAKPAGTVGAPQ